MQQGRVEEGMEAELKLRNLQRMSPAERRRIREQRRRKRDRFMKKAVAVMDETPKEYIGQNGRFSKEDLAAARLHGIEYHLLYERVVIKGWSLEDAMRKPVNFHQWTDEEVALVRKLLLEGKSGREIARHLPGRSQSAVESRCSGERRQLRKEGLL